MPNNEDRRLRAWAALSTYRDKDQQSAEENLSDLLADLRHWAQYNDIDFVQCNRMGYLNYYEEVEEEKGTPVVEPDKAFTDGECETALCIWEEMLSIFDQRNEERPIYQYFQNHGAADTRWEAMGLVKPMEAAYQAVKHQYDDPFDWEFVPHMLAELESAGLLTHSDLSVSEEAAVILARDVFLDPPL